MLLAQLVMTGMMCTLRGIIRQLAFERLGTTMLTENDISRYISLYTRYMRYHISPSYRLYTAASRLIAEYSGAYRRIATKISPV